MGSTADGGVAVFDRVPILSLTVKVTFEHGVRR
jgi:hypothetical protein